MKNVNFKIIVAIILVAYAAVLVKLIVFKYPPGMVFDVASANYVPFKTILLYLSGEPSWAIAFRNLVGNIIPFIPLGLIAPFLCRPLKWRQVLAVAILVAVAIEGVQVILRTGIFDVDDIVLNLAGVVFGYAIFVVGRHLIASFVRK